jgi:hypothetical protein
LTGFFVFLFGFYQPFEEIRLPLEEISIPLEGKLSPTATDEVKNTKNFLTNKNLGDIIDKHLSERQNFPRSDKIKR